MSVEEARKAIEGGDSCWGVDPKKVDRLILEAQAEMPCYGDEWGIGAAKHECPSRTARMEIKETAGVIFWYRGMGAWSYLLAAPFTEQGEPQKVVFSHGSRFSVRPLAGGEPIPVRAVDGFLWRDDDTALPRGVYKELPAKHECPSCTARMKLKEER